MTDKEITAHLKVIIELLKEIKRVQDRHEVNTDKEISDLHDFTVEVARLGGQMEAFRKSQKNQTDKITDQVEEVTQPIIEEANKLKNVIKDKKFIKIKGKHWWKFWGR